MSILTDYLPEAVEIEGEVYELNTDFRTGIDIMLAYEDFHLSDREKVMVMVMLLYKEMPQNLHEAARLAVKFLNCGDDAKDGAAGIAQERLYSFEKDAKYIYSAINQSHGIDLNDVPYLHWWKFCYMFLDLKEDCFFTRMIYYRKNLPQGKLTKEEREYCSAIRDILELPQNISREELEAEERFMGLLENNGCNRIADDVT
ncbi:MAG: bacteriophage Gp15 family protein [Eubacteriales bacterium]|nr:bacteriophage Gp15 family protein [Eubacteriales bacterium]